MDQCAIEIGLAASAQGTSALARSLPELARWGRLVGRLDGGRQLLGGPRAELTRAAALGRSTIRAGLDEVGQRTFRLACRQGWTEWMATCWSGAPAVAAR